jgi:serine/threonine-protein kinase
MDLLEGGTLRDVIRSSAPLSPERAVELLRPLASALDYAHAHGVIHRDIKPGNVMVGKDNHVTLVDFGIARAAEEARMTRSGTVVGTAEYMAPEAFTSAGSDQNGDRYALGVIAYELLTGHAPFRGNPTVVTYAQVNTPPPSPRSFQPALPVWTEQALLRQLAKSPAERFPSATAFVDALVTPPAGRSRREDPTIPFPRPDLAAGTGPETGAPPPGMPVTPGTMPPTAMPASPGTTSPSPSPPRPAHLPGPPRPHLPEPPDSGTVFHRAASPAPPPAAAPERAGVSGGRLAAFVLIVLAIVVVGSVLIWQRIASPARVAEAPPGPTAAPAPTNAPGATSAPATAAPTPGPAQPAAPPAPPAPTAAPSAPTTAPAAPTTAPAAPAAPAPTAAPSAATSAPSPAPAAPPTSPPVAASPAPAPAFQTVLDEHFADNQRGWPNNQESTAWLDNGVYRLNARDPGRFVSVGAPGIGPFADVEVSGRFKKVGGPPGGGFGLIVRDQGPDPRDGLNQGGRYYVLEVGEGQQWGMWRRETDHWVDLQPFTPSDVVKPPGQENELIARAIGSHLIFIVNGVQIADIEDPTLTNGKVGIYVAGDGNIVEASQFTVRAPR